MTEKLGLTVVPLQLNIGSGNDFLGVIDLITMKALYFEGDNGENQVEKEIPAELEADAAQARQTMLEALSMHCDELLSALLEDKPISIEIIQQTIREATISRDIVPVMMGTAYKNKGVQPLLDGVCRYLPSPLDRPIFARDHDNQGAEVMLASDPQAPLVAMAFKIVDETFGQLTYTRVYQGTLTKGKQYRNARTNKMQRVGRIVRMHANDRKDIDEALPGDIVAMVAVDCASGDTFCDEDVNFSLESIFVADPVIRLSVTPASSADQDKMAKALNRFMREDPTFRVSTDPQTSETIIAGMGELHLDIYVERMKREYKANVVVGAPRVSYREAPQVEAKFDYKHKKQSGGSGQYGHVVGRMIPLSPTDENFPYEFEDNVRQGRIPNEFIPAVNRGFQEAMKKGPLAGYEIVGCKMALDDGSYHDVDSSEMAFRIAGIEAFRQAFLRSKPVILEPVMKVEVECPPQHQGTIVGDLNSRRGMIHATENRGTFTVINAEVPLANMFGYATIVRSLSQGMATFTMELARYAKVPTKIAEEIIANRRKELAAEK
jgi:elongation factor G